MERGFDKLMTPMGVNVVVLAMFFFFVVIAAGGVWWRLRDQALRRGETLPSLAPPADAPPPSEGP